VKKKTKKTSKQNINVKESTYNFFYNIIIFILAILILYLSYSAYLKLIHYSPGEEQAENSKQSSEKIQLDVLNGCGVSGVADRFTDFLRAHNFDVIETGNYKSFNVDETFIIDRVGNKQNALKIARAIGIGNAKVINGFNKDYLLDASLVIGKDYYKLKPITGGD